MSLYIATLIGVGLNGGRGDGKFVCDIVQAKSSSRFMNSGCLHVLQTETHTHAMIGKGTPLKMSCSVCISPSTRN